MGDSIIVVSLYLPLQFYMAWQFETGLDGEGTDLPRGLARGEDKSTYWN